MTQEGRTAQFVTRQASQCVATPTTEAMTYGRQTLFRRSNTTTTRNTLSPGGGPIGDRRKFDSDSERVYPFEVPVSDRPGRLSQPGHAASPETGNATYVSRPVSRVVGGPLICSTRLSRWGAIAKAVISFACKCVVDEPPITAGDAAASTASVTRLIRTPVIVSSSRSTQKIDDSFDLVKNDLN